MSKNTEVCTCNIIHQEVIDRVEGRIPEEELLESVSNFFKVFSDKTRLKILSLLLLEEMCVCDIAAALDMTHSSISHQLRVLRQARIVKNRKDGKVVYYSLEDEHVKNIIAQSLSHHQH